MMGTYDYKWTTGTTLVLAVTVAMPGILIGFAIFATKLYLSYLGIDLSLVWAEISQIPTLF